jgi:hypothetical protein
VKFRTLTFATFLLNKLCSKKEVSHWLKKVNDLVAKPPLESLRKGTPNGKSYLFYTGNRVPLNEKGVARTYEEIGRDDSAQGVGGDND